MLIKSQDTSSMLSSKLLKLALGLAFFWLLVCLGGNLGRILVCESFDGFIVIGKGIGTSGNPYIIKMSTAVKAEDANIIFTLF